MGLKSFLPEKEFTVAGDFRRYDNLPEIIQAFHPEILLVGVSFYKKTISLEAIKAARQAYPELPIVAALATENPAVMREAVECGATHYFFKSASASEILRVLREVSEGRQDKLGKFWTRISGFHPPYHERPEEELTWREREVLHLVSLGFSNQKIAESLGISMETAKEHVQNLIRKLRVENRTQAAVLAVRMGE